MLYYVLLAHTQPKQVENLCNRLKWNIFIHLDKSQDIHNRNYISEKNDDVTFIKNRVKINWWWFSMIEWTINWLKEISKSLTEDDHVIIMSWQDYPIKSINDINNYFKMIKWKSVLKIYDDLDWNKELINRYSWWYFRDLSIPKLVNSFFYTLWCLFSNFKDFKNPITIYIIERLLNFILPKRKYLLNKFKIYWGSQRMALSWKHVKYLLNYLKTNEWLVVLNNYKRVLIPDETFFQTILMNSKYKTEIIDKSLWYIDWDTWPEFPKILRREDYDKIMNSGKLFARKFGVISWSLIEYINKTILT